MRILLFAALPQEYASFQRRSGRWRLLTRRPFRQSLCLVSGKELLLVETGMGESSMEKAMEWACAKCRPDMIVSMGFAGSLSRNLCVGDVLVGCESVRSCPVDRSGAAAGSSSQRRHFIDVTQKSSTDEGFILNLPVEIVDFFKGTGVPAGRIVTVAEPQDKAFMAERFRDIPSVMDMETHVAARFACDVSIPFLCLRSISDGVSDAIGYDLGAITDCRGKVRIVKVAGAVLRRPWLLKSFAVSWRRAVRAADGLGRALCSLLNFPTPSLLSLVAGCRVERRGGEKKGQC